MAHLILFFGYLFPISFHFDKSPNTSHLPVLFCPLFNIIFNIMRAFLLVSRPLDRKKSILAKVCFDAK